MTDIFEDQGLAFLNVPPLTDEQIRERQAKENNQHINCPECGHGWSVHWKVQGGCVAQWCSCERQTYDVSPVVHTHVKQYSESEIKSLLKEIWRLVLDIHIGCIDQFGEPEIFHILRVAGQAKDLDTLCVALLHMVCERTGKDIDLVLKDYHFRLPRGVQSALRLLAYKKDEVFLHLFLFTEVIRSISLHNGIYKSFRFSHYT